MPMEVPFIDFDSLTHQQLKDAAKCARIEDEVYDKTDYELVGVLTARPDFTEGQRKILNQWFTFKQAVRANTVADIMRIAERPADAETTPNLN